MTTYFISGHLSLTPEEFTEHYQPRIDQAIKDGAHFVVGDARGADAMAQEYLSGQLGETAADRVTVFHMFDYPRNCADYLQVEAGYTSDELRDHAMTVASDADIAWVRPGREKSGTAENLNRRKRYALPVQD